jgi:hypothetical protein
LVSWGAGVLLWAKLPPFIAESAMMVYWWWKEDEKGFGRYWVIVYGECVQRRDGVIGKGWLKFMYEEKWVVMKVLIFDFEQKKLSGDDGWRGIQIYNVCSSSHSWLGAGRGVAYISGSSFWVFEICEAYELLMMH